MPRYGKLRWALFDLDPTLAALFNLSRADQASDSHTDTPLLNKALPRIHGCLTPKIFSRHFSRSATRLKFSPPTPIHHSGPA